MAARSGVSSVQTSLHRRDCGDQVRVAQLAERLALNEPDALARQAEHLARLAQRERLAILQPVSQRDDVTFALVQNAVDLPSVDKPDATQPPLVELVRIANWYGCRTCGTLGACWPGTSTAR